MGELQRIAQLAYKKKTKFKNESRPNTKNSLSRLQSLKFRRNWNGTLSEALIIVKDAGVQTTTTQERSCRQRRKPLALRRIFNTAEFNTADYNRRCCTRRW